MPHAQICNPVMEDSITAWQTLKTLREGCISLCKEKLLWEVTFVLFLYYLTTWSSRQIHSREVHNRVRKLNNFHSVWEDQKESVLVAKEWGQIVGKSKYEQGIPANSRNWTLTSAVHARISPVTEYQKHGELNHCPKGRLGAAWFTNTTDLNITSSTTAKCTFISSTWETFTKIASYISKTNLKI